MYSLLILFICLSCNNVLSLPLPFNQYAYIQARNELKSKYDHFNLLSEKENLVNLYFEKQKIDEFRNTSTYFYPSRPLESELDQIVNRTLYKLLKKLPKGGNLHMHETQMLDRRKFLELVYQLPEYDYLYICDKSSDAHCVNKPSDCNCTNYQLKYYKKAAPFGWFKVKGSAVWTTEKILEKTTLTGIINNMAKPVYATDSAGRWNLTSTGLFFFYDELFRYNNTRFSYMTAVLDDSLDEGVQVLEFRRGGFGSMFYFDEHGNEISISDTDELDLLWRYKSDYIKNNPRLIDFIFIVYGSRRSTDQVVDSLLERTFYLQNLYQDMIRGFDLVGQEDSGHTLLFHRDSLIEGFNFTQSSNKTFNLVFHTAETSWPDDIEPAQIGDDVSTLDNIFDAILLKTKRVGHGIGFVKYPKLYKYLIEREIAIEVCPASNQILGYVPDLRNHPGINYYKSGIPIVIAGDDPGSFGYNQLTVDYYMIYLAWGLDLYDLKQIANNSIRYSLMPEEKRSQGYEKFNLEWNSFIDIFYQSICTQKSKNSMQLNVTDLLPAYGPNDQSIDVFVYGFGFDMAFCQEVSCLFDEVRTDGVLYKIDQIRCATPTGFSVNQVASLSIQIGNNVYNTGKKYKFVSPDSTRVINEKESALD